MRLAPLFILLFLAIAAYGYQTSVAVLPSDGTVLSNDELEVLTDKMREAALKILPTDAFVLLKQDVVIRRLGGAENYIKECSESSCIVNLGKKAQVDYVAQASVGKLGNKIRLKIELYNVSTEGLVGMLSNEESENIMGLLGIVENRAPEVFSKILNASSGSSTTPSAVVLAAPQPQPPPTPVAKPKKKTPKPPPDLVAVPVVQAALSGSNLPKGCSEDFANILGKDDFDMAKFMKDVPQDVAKVRLQLKSPFGKPKDGDKTNSGLTVGCVKALPESPAEITSLLKDISLKMGLDLAVDAVASVADNHIPKNIPANVETKSGEKSRTSFWVALGLDVVGAAVIIGGYVKHSQMNTAYDQYYRTGSSNDWNEVESYHSSRNALYIVGGVLLASGIGVHIWF